MKLTLPSQALPSLPALSENRIARFAAIMGLYFMRGVPLGLSTVAIPAWLAASCASLLQVGAFVGTAIFPWSLKPLNGILMDRVAFKPMGRRRAWKATGKLFNPQIAPVWTAENGKITSYQQHVDTLAVAIATGKVA